MMQEKKQIFWLTLAVTIVLSSLSLFIVRQDEVDSGNQILHEEQGVAIYCDESKGQSKNMCVGKYTRGWPIAEANGTLVLSTTGRVNHRLEFDLVKSLLNKSLYVLPALALVIGVRKVGRKE